MPKSKKPARNGKQPAAQTSQAGWFTIRRILDERRIGNRIQYLVDWDDDAETGHTHEPTWVLVSRLVYTFRAICANQLSEHRRDGPRQERVEE